MFDYELKLRHIPKEIVFDQLDPHWIASDKREPLVYFANSLSIFLCFFERYLIEVVREAMPLIEDQHVLTLVRQFIGQEARHTSYHQDFNRMLLNAHYPQLKNNANWEKVFMSKLYQPGLEEKLLQVIFCELLTASLARYFFKHIDLVLEKANPAAAYLFGYHAAEELEHCAVCFDLYTLLYGQKPNVSQACLQAYETCESMYLNTLQSGIAYMYASDAMVQGHQVDARAWAKDVLFLENGAFPGQALCPYFLDPSYYPLNDKIQDFGYLDQWDNAWSHKLLKKLKS